MSLLSSLPEDFLHYVWRSLSFEVRKLRTTTGEAVEILDPGTWNHDQGPDFLQAKLRIGGLIWHGHVELHVMSNAWYQHAHHLDQAYNNTILHVVLKASQRQIFRQDGTAIPELELQGRIAPEVVARYQHLQLSQQHIPCANLIGEVSPELRQPWVEELGLARLLSKVQVLQQGLQQQVQDWAQVLWEAVAAAMMGPVNQAPGREMARRAPVKIWQTYAQDLQRLEALLFGVGGWLQQNHQGDSFYEALQSHWEYLQTKHQLPSLSPLPFRFMRMRPSAFPTIRISQTAALLHQFPQLIELLSTPGMRAFMKIPLGASAYWEHHYRFFEHKSGKVKRIGRAHKHHLLINTLLPMAYLYEQAHGRQELESVLLTQMRAIPPERNRYTRVYTELGFANQHALHSQGLIALHKGFCQVKKCLHCKIGKQLLTTSP